MSSKHYIGVSGLRGYMPNHVGVYDSIDSAAEGLREINEFSKAKLRELKQHRYIDLNLSKHGAEYAEISECNCDYPEDHDESYC